MWFVKFLIKKLLILSFLCNKSSVKIILIVATFKSMAAGDSNQYLYFHFYTR